MARYIDADAFKQKLADKDIFFPALYKNELDDMTTEDVVPRAEVEELYKEIDRLSQVVLYNDSVTEMKVDEAKTEVAREIFKEIEKVVGYALCVDLADWSAYTELKKKYTENC